MASTRRMRAGILVAESNCERVDVCEGGAGVLPPGGCRRGCTVHFCEGILLASQRHGAAPSESPRYLNVQLV